MRIAFVLPGSGVSGGVRVTERFAAGLLERGHDVSILYRSTPVDLRSLARTAYIKLRYRNTSGWLWRFAGPQRGYRRLTARLVGKNDIVVAVGPIAAHDMAPLPPACGVKVEFVHGSAQAPELVREAWQRPWPKLVVANHLRRAIEDQGYGPVVAVVPNGVDTSDYFPDGPELRRIAVGTVWHPGWAKDPDAILDVLARLRAARANLPLLAFGSRKRPNGFPPGTSYVRLPSVAVARKMYSRCRVWFCASCSEGFGLPLLEAVCCGCAVVTTDCGGPADIIQDGVNGFLVPVGDAATLTQHILRLLDDTDLWARITQRRTETAAAFSWARAVDSLETALLRIGNAR